jgi:hypothetical protein
LADNNQRIVSGEKLVLSMGLYSILSVYPDPDPRAIKIYGTKMKFKKSSTQIQITSNLLKKEECKKWKTLESLHKLSSFDRIKIKGVTKNEMIQGHKKEWEIIRKKMQTDGCINIFPCLNTSRVLILVFHLQVFLKKKI